MRAILAIVALVAGAFFVLPDERAQATADVSPEVVERIKLHCVENQATLNRLHQTDAFLRNNRGNLYRTISDKLMVPLNRRLASNQLDGGALLTIASNYKTEYDTFYRTYIEYDNALADVLKIDCKKEPVAFYTQLTEAREKRLKLSESNQRLKDFVREYGVVFTDLKAAYEKDNS
jgi:hypothetical protein